MSKKPTVYFVATALGEVHHGPAVYTRALWDLFHDGEQIDFHLIVLKSEIEHPRIHVPLNESGQRRGFYKRLANHIQASVPQDKSSFLLHVNSAHLISGALAARYRTIVQINDTEVCQHKNSIARVRQYGLRRVLALQWRQMREKSVVANSELVVCNSDFTTRTVRESYGLNRDKTTRVYKAVPLEPFLNETPQNLESSGLKIVFIGNNWQRKGLQVLIEAVGKIVRTDSQLPIELAVYGKPSSADLKYFGQYAASQGVQDNVQFAGVLGRDAAPGVISRSTVLVLPSFEEALGLVSIEAMATGIPVVGSNVGGIPEVINDKRLGSLVKVGDPQALANAIVAQYHDRSENQPIGYRKDSSKRFSTQSLKQSIETLYRKHF